MPEYNPAQFWVFKLQIWSQLLHMARYHFASYFVRVVYFQT
jgi:hypothetical protein